MHIYSTAVRNAGGSIVPGGTRLSGTTVLDIQKGLFPISDQWQVPPSLLQNGAGHERECVLMQTTFMRTIFL
jgi:hypothetical protein